MIDVKGLLFHRFFDMVMIPLVVAIGLTLLLCLGLLMGIATIISILKMVM